MAKFQDIRALAKQQLQAVTKNGECWKAFLHTAAIAYNYNFPNQLLIYCQNPTATAVADMEYWNKEAGRQVKRGAHGIPILDVKKEMMALRYLFDISDTIPQARTDEGLPWAVTDQNWKPVWDKIIRDNQADSIQNALLMLSTSYVAQRRGMFLHALAQSADGSSLGFRTRKSSRKSLRKLRNARTGKARPLMRPASMSPNKILRMCCAVAAALRAVTSACRNTFPTHSCLRKKNRLTT